MSIHDRPLLFHSSHGQILSLEVTPQMTVGEAKNILCNQANEYQINESDLIYNNEPLQENKKISEIDPNLKQRIFVLANKGTTLQKYIFKNLIFGTYSLQLDPKTITGTIKKFFIEAHPELIPESVIFKYDRKNILCEDEKAIEEFGTDTIKVTAKKVPVNRSAHTPKASVAPPPRASVAPPPKSSVAPPPKRTVAPPPKSTVAPPPKSTVAPPPKSTVAPPPKPTAEEPPKSTVVSPPKPAAASQPKSDANEQQKEENTQKPKDVQTIEVHQTTEILTKQEPPQTSNILQISETPQATEIHQDDVKPQLPEKSPIPEVKENPPQLTIPQQPLTQPQPLITHPPVTPELQDISPNPPISQQTVQPPELQDISPNTHQQHTPSSPSKSTPPPPPQQRETPHPKPKKQVILEVEPMKREPIDASTPLPNHNFNGFTPTQRQLDSIRACITDSPEILSDFYKWLKRINPEDAQIIKKNQKVINRLLRINPKPKESNLQDIQKTATTQQQEKENQTQTQTTTPKITPPKIYEEKCKVFVDFLKGDKTSQKAFMDLHKTYNTIDPADLFGVFVSCDKNVNEVMRNLPKISSSS